MKPVDVPPQVYEPPTEGFTLHVYYASTEALITDVWDIKFEDGAFYVFNKDGDMIEAFKEWTRFKIIRDK